MRGYRFACDGLPHVVGGGGLELVRAAACGGGGGQDDSGEGSAAAATAAARSEFVASVGGEEALAASVELLAGCMARGDGTGGDGGDGGSEGSEGAAAASDAGAAVLTVGALLGLSPLPRPVDARAKRMAACDPDRAPVRASEWELRTPSLAASGLVAVLVHRRKSHARSYCVAQSDDEEVASGFKVEHDEQWWADQGDGVNTITRSRFNADLSVRLEADSNADAGSDSEGPQGGGVGTACPRELQLLNVKIFTHRDSWDTRQRDLDVVANVANLKHLRRLFFGPASPSLPSSPAAGQAMSLSCFADALFSISSSRLLTVSDVDDSSTLDEAFDHNEDIEEGCAHLMSREAKLFVWRARSEGSLPAEDAADAEDGGEGGMADDESEGGGGDDNAADETVENMFWGKAGGKAGTSKGFKAEEEAEVAGSAGDTPAPALAAAECFPFPLALAPALEEDSTATDGCEEPAAKRNRPGSPQPSDDHDEGGGDDGDEDGDAPGDVRVGCARLCASAGISVASAAGLRLVEELLLPALTLRLVAHLTPPEPQADSGEGGGDGGAPAEMGVGDVALAAGRYLGQRSDAALRLSPYAGEVLDAVLRSGEGSAGGAGATLEGLLRTVPPAHAAVLRARLASASFSAPLGALGALPDAALVACLRHHDPSPLGLPLPSVGVLTLRESGSGSGGGGAAAWSSPEEATVGGLALVAVLRQVHPNLVLGPCAAACLADLLRAFAAHAAAGASRATARRLSTEAGETVEVTVADVVRCGALPGELAKHGASEAKKAATKLAAGDQSAGLVMALPADLVAQLQERVCGPGVALGAGALAALGGMVEYVCTTALSA